MKNKFENAQNYPQEKEGESDQEDVQKSKLRKNADLVHGKDVSKAHKKDVYKDSKKLVKSQANLIKAPNKLLTNNSKFKKGINKAERDRKFTPIVLTGDSEAESANDEDVESELDSYDKSIENIDDLFDALRVNIEQETDTELVLKTSHYKNSISVPKEVLAQFGDRFQSRPDMKIETNWNDPGKINLSGKDTNIVMNKLLLDDRSPISKSYVLLPFIDYEIEQLRIGDDFATDRKGTSTSRVSQKDKSPAKATSNNGLKNILQNLEEMSGNSTLMDGMDSDDDAPPPLFAPKDLPVNKV